MKTILFLFTLLLVPGFFHQAQAENIVYVREGGTGDGSSWAEASGDFKQTVFDASRTPDAIVYVSEGIYTADVFISSEVELYGGFPATGNPTVDDRDPVAYPTVLTGDVNGDDADIDLDGFPEANRSDNSAKLLTFNTSGSSGVPTVDGFILEGVGDPIAEDSGTAIHSNGINVQNCVFRYNNGNSAACMRMTESGLLKTSIIRDCLFSQNIGMMIVRYTSAIDDAHLFFYRTRFIDNSSSLSGDRSFLGMIWLSSSDENTSATFLECVITNQRVRINSVLFNVNGVKLGINNSVIVDNLSPDGEPLTIKVDNDAMININNSTLGDVEFNVPSEGPTPETYHLNIVNSILFDSSLQYNKPIGMQNCLYYNLENYVSDIADTNIMADPLFLNAADPDGPDNIWFTVDDGLQLTEDSPAVDFGENTALIDDIADLDGDGDVDEVIPFDVLGNARLVGAKVDAGAYEFDGTDPNDSDGDGLPDTWEQLLVDADPNDAITTVAEVLGTDDFDSDGLTNAEELAQFTSPIKWDSDGDGYSDKQELDAGKDPNSALSQPMGFHIVTAIELRFYGTPGKDYQVQYRDSFDAAWENFGDPVSGNASGGMKSVLISFEGENKKREQYRVVETDQ